MGSDSATHIDDSIVLWLTSVAGRSAAFDSFMEILLHAELTNGALVISIFWWYWFRPTDPPSTQRTREYLLCTMAAAALSLFAARVLALTLPFRLRPRFEPALHLVWPPVAPGALIFVHWSSFPSDHAVMFSALATGLCFVSWRVGAAALLFAACVVSFPRVYVGLHYPTDVLAGLGLGALVAYCANAIAVSRRLAARVLLQEQRSPQGFYVAMFIVTFQFATMFNTLRSAARHAFLLGGRLLAAALANLSGH